MKNITKLACWPELQKLGFVPIKYKFRGRTVHIGASLIIGCSDRITIEPHSYKTKPYHISGKLNTPQFIHNTAGSHVFDFMNNHFNANEILTTVQTILK